MIKIGIESTAKQLHDELLLHPSRYFFLLVTDERACLRFRTCKSDGMDVRAHIIDGLIPDPNGNLKYQSLKTV